MDNKLLLAVRFDAVDKMSGALKNITSSGKTGAKILRDMKDEARKLERELGDVRKQIVGGLAGGGKLQGLVQREKELASAANKANAQLDIQKGKFARIEKFKGTTQKIAAGAGTAGAIASATLTAPLIAIGIESVNAAREAKAAEAQVTASLASMGGGAGRSLEQLKANAEGLMKTSLFDDDEILKSVTANLLTFGKVQGPIFDRAQQAAVDLASKMGGDLQGRTLQIGKALQDPVKGITALGRAGVQFSDDQKAMIKSMVASGQTAKAQGLILAELEKQVGGSGEAARNADPMAAANIDLGEAKQAMGEALVPIMTKLTKGVTFLIEKFNGLSPATKQWIAGGLALVAIIGPLLLGVSGLVMAFGAIPAIIGFVGGAFALLFSPIGLVVAAIVGAAALIYFNWESIKAAFVAGWNMLTGFGAKMAGLGKAIVMGLVNGLLGAGSAVVNALMGIAQKGVTAFKNFFGIKSPSRLFMGMGGHMADGLAIGIDKGAKRPLRSVARMAGGVAGAGALALTPAFAATPASAAAQGPRAQISTGAAQPITINVYGADGQDVKALADEVMRRIERANGVKSRSRYDD